MMHGDVSGNVAVFFFNDVVSHRFIPYLCYSKSLNLIRTKIDNLL